MRVALRAYQGAGATILVSTSTSIEHAHAPLGPLTPQLVCTANTHACTRTPVRPAWCFARTCFAGSATARRLNSAASSCCQHTAAPTAAHSAVSMPRRSWPYRVSNSSCACCSRNLAGWLGSLATAIGYHHGVVRGGEIQLRREASQAWPLSCRCRSALLALILEAFTSPMPPPRC